jgi:hypothetical protein
LDTLLVDSIWIARGLASQGDYRKDDLTVSKSGLLNWAAEVFRPFIVIGSLKSVNSGLDVV